MFDEDISIWVKKITQNNKKDHPKHQLFLTQLEVFARFESYNVSTKISKWAALIWTNSNKLSYFISLKQALCLR